MDRNSNLEHLWNFAMPNEDRYRRSLMYKPSNKKVPSKGNGGTAPVVPNIDSSVQKEVEGFKTYLPTHETTKKQARLYAYKQILDSALAAKNPTAWKKIQGQYTEDTPIHERIAKAHGYIQDNTYPYSLNEDEMKVLLGEDYQDFNTLRSEQSKLWGLEVAGAGEKGETTQQTEYGLRNSWSIPNPRYSRTISVKGIPQVEAEGRTVYDPAKKAYQYSYTTKPVVKKKGGLLKVNPKPSEREERLQDKSDKRINSSLRRPNEVPGSINKVRLHRQ